MQVYCIVGRAVKHCTKLTQLFVSLLDECVLDPHALPLTYC